MKRFQVQTSFGALILLYCYTIQRPLWSASQLQEGDHNELISLRRYSVHTNHRQTISNRGALPQLGGTIDQRIPHNFTFHSWGKEGIELDPILQFINGTYYDPKTTEQGWYDELYGKFPGFIAMHNGSRPMMWFPKKVLRRRSTRDIINKRLKRMLPRFQHSLKKILFDFPERFQAIFNVLEKVGSFPIVMQLDDYRGCLKDNYNTPDNISKSLPIMTLCRQKGCQYSFPIPGYGTYTYATIPKSGTWGSVFEKWAETYPNMEDKIPKAFWRGSCNGGEKTHRLVLADRSQGHDTYLDVKLTGGRWCTTGYSLAVNLTPPEESMRYRATLDIDGNSWSERFPRLLCYNSVVIKVDTELDYDEYFMPSLVPGVHYLAASLDNYTEVAKWAVQDSSLPEIKRIVTNANAWCNQTMRPTRLNYDFLTVLNGIVNGLNANDPNWIERWRMVQNSYVGAVIDEAHEGFAYRVWPVNLLDASPEMQGLVVTKLSEMTERL